MKYFVLSGLFLLTLGYRLTSESFLPITKIDERESETVGLVTVTKFKNAYAEKCSLSNLSTNELSNVFCHTHLLIGPEIIRAR